jgi:hypothetical protein
VAEDEPVAAAVDCAIARPPGASTPEGYVVSFVCFHERGFGVPVTTFICALLHYYRVELHHLAPNAVAQAAIFVAVCEGYLGMEP